MKREIQFIIRQMLFELESNSLKIALVPQQDPDNPGACIRQVVSRNCDWYRKFCSEFESDRKTLSRKFKTKIKRRYIIDLLRRMSAGKDTQSKYRDKILSYAENELDKIYQN